MEIPKPTEDDRQFFLGLIPDDPDVEVKPMFGNLGAFVHGTMFAGLFGSAVGVRLAEPDAAELAAVDGSGPNSPANMLPCTNAPRLPNIGLTSTSGSSGIRPRKNCLSSSVGLGISIPGL